MACMFPLKTEATVLRQGLEYGLGAEARTMDRHLATKLSPFVLLVIASCGSSSSGGNGSTPSEDGGGTDGTVEGEDGQASSGQGGETSGGSESGSPGGSGGASGSSSGASSGGGSGASSGSGSGSTADGGPTADNSVYQMHNHINRDGLFVDGALTKTALMGKTLKIDPTFAGTVTGKMYASPLYVQNGVNHKGTFYVVTEANNVYALDEATGNNAIKQERGHGAIEYRCRVWAHQSHRHHGHARH
jgi:hypothetical protein